jgi:hypothetical protein
VFQKTSVLLKKQIFLDKLWKKVIFIGAEEKIKDNNENLNN